MPKGLLISFDGVDSSGKETQAKLLSAKLSQTGRPVLNVATPDYTTDTGQQLKALFTATTGGWNDLTWQQQMKLLAANRAEHKAEVIETLSAGGFVVYDRYVPSSLTHMAVSAAPADQIELHRSAVHLATKRHEYDVNGMPREDASIFLDVPPQVSDKLLEQRQAEQHAAAEQTDDLVLQQRIYQEYQWLLKHYPDHYMSIQCVKDEQLLDRQDIADSVWRALTSKFPQLNA